MLLIPTSYILSKNSCILLISIEDYLNNVKNSSYVLENINVMLQMNNMDIVS